MFFFLSPSSSSCCQQELILAGGTESVLYLWVISVISQLIELTLAQLAPGSIFSTPGAPLIELDDRKIETGNPDQFHGKNM